MNNIKDYIFQNEKDKNTDSKIAIIQDHQSITYSELENLIDKFSLKLILDGVEKGSFIALYMTDSIDLISSFWGAIQIGVIPVLINIKTSLPILEYIYKNSNCTAMYLNKTMKDKESEINFTNNIYYWSDFEQKQICWRKVKLIENTETQPIFVLYTSGSTGKPKGVIHSQKSIKAICENYQYTNCRFQKEDTIFSMSKIPFALGVGTSCILSQYCKATLIISEFEIISNIQKLANKNSPTVLVGVPSIYSSLLDLFSKNNLLFESLRLCICCGEPLPPIVSEKWKDRYDVPLFEGMGTSEFLYIFFLNTDKTGKKVGSVGIPISGYQTSVLDELENPIINRIGNLYIEGSSIMKGYIGQTPIQDKGMYTGDKFKIDLDGYYWYMGRTNDLFKINGEWCKASDIEFLILNYEEIIEAAVDLQSNNSLNYLVYYLVVSNPLSFNVTNFKRFLRKKLNARLRPQEIVLVNEIPKGITGKINRLELKKLEPIKTFTSI